MSVCVSSSLNSGMTHVSHLHLTSSLSMMQPFQSHHQMAPSSTILPSNLDISPHAQQSNPQLQMQNSSSSSSSDANDPNPEMLLALIARNKTLEGECRRYKSFLVLQKFAVGKRKKILISKCFWLAVNSVIECYQMCKNSKPKRSKVSEGGFTRNVIKCVKSNSYRVSWKCLNKPLKLFILEI